MIVLAGLAVAGAGLQLVVSPAWAGLREREPVLRPGTPNFADAGSSLVLAMAGGVRAVLADVTWLHMQLLWERRDWVATDLLLHSVAAIDPRPLYFWLNGARIIACDFPAWRIEANGGHARVPAAGQLQIRHLSSTLGS